MDKLLPGQLKTIALGAIVLITLVIAISKAQNYVLPSPDGKNVHLKVENNGVSIKIKDSGVTINVDDQELYVDKDGIRIIDDEDDTSVETTVEENDDDDDWDWDYVYPDDDVIPTMKIASKWNTLKFR